MEMLFHLNSLSSCSGAQPGTGQVTYFVDDGRCNAPVSSDGTNSSHVHPCRAMSLLQPQKQIAAHCTAHRDFLSTDLPQMAF